MADTQPLSPTGPEIIAVLRPLYASDEAASMGAADDLRTARAVLARWGQPAHSGEPVAWRYVPSKVWGEFVYTKDPKRAQHARDNGIDVQPVFTTPQPTQAQAGARKRDDVLIRQCMEALECAGAYTALIDDISLSAIQEAYKAARARLEGKP